MHNHPPPPKERQNVKHHGVVSYMHIYIYIYKVTKTGNNLNDHYTDTHNAIFGTVLRHT
jgi:hypothetical protein